MRAPSPRTSYDVAIVGGGPAGLQAALVLGRMRRHVLLCDTHTPANAVSHGVGGLLSRDGIPPAELRAIGREQLAEYPSVLLRDEEVHSARLGADGFEISMADETVVARRLLLAHGLAYERPEIDGLEDLWGDAVFHCPYCHGWEVRAKAIGIVATGPKAARQALLLGSLSDDITLIPTGWAPDPDERALLERIDAKVLESTAERIERDGDGVRLHLAEGEPASFDALFIQPDLALPCDLAGQLGAELADDGTIATEAGGATSVAGLYAAGDAGPAPQAVAVAIGAGAEAAYAINLDLALADAG